MGRKKKVKKVLKTRGPKKKIVSSKKVAGQNTFKNNVYCIASGYSQKAFCKSLQYLLI